MSMNVELTYRVWYSKGRAKKQHWEELSAINRDDALIRFAKVMGDRVYKILKIEENVIRGGFKTPPKDKPKREPPKPGVNDFERGEWWKKGEQPPDDIEE